MKKLVILAALVCAATWLCAQQPQTQTAPISALNAKYANGVAPGYAPTAGSGLTLHLGAGTANCAGAIAAYAGGTLTMSAAATNYVYLDTSASCAPAVKTTAFTQADIPVAVVVAGASAITSIGDVRTPFVKPGSNCPTATSSTQGCSQPDNSTVTIRDGVLSATVSGGFENYVADPLGTQRVVVPFTVNVNNDDGDPAVCPILSNTTSGTITIHGHGASLGCSNPGVSITWSAAQLPSYVVPANVTAIYAVGTVGYQGTSQAIDLKCTAAGNTILLMSQGGGVLTTYSASLTGATGANIGTISCVAEMGANTGGADNPVMNIPSIYLSVYYTGTAPPASTALNVTPCLYVNTALNSMGVSAVNLAGIGDCGVTGLLPNANLANPSMTIDGTTCTLGGSCSPTVTDSQGLLITSGICTADGSSYATCTMAQVNWPSSFGSASAYVVKCQGIGPSNGTGAAGSVSGDIYTVTKSADGAGITIQLETNTSSGFSYSEIDCTGKPL